MAPRGKVRLYVSDEITLLRDRYEFTLVEIAKHIGAKAQTVGTWQESCRRLAYSAPEHVGYKIRQLLQIAELLETEGGIQPQFVSMQLRLARVDGKKVVDLLPDDYPWALQLVRQYCQEDH